MMLGLFASNIYVLLYALCIYCVININELYNNVQPDHSRNLHNIVIKIILPPLYKVQHSLLNFSNERTLSCGQYKIKKVVIT